MPMFAEALQRRNCNCIALAFDGVYFNGSGVDMKGCLVQELLNDVWTTWGVEPHIKNLSGDVLVSRDPLWDPMDSQPVAPSGPRSGSQTPMRKRRQREMLAQSKSNLASAKFSLKRFLFATPGYFLERPVGQPPSCLRKKRPVSATLVVARDMLKPEEDAHWPVCSKGRVVILSEGSASKPINHMLLWRASKKYARILWQSNAWQVPTHASSPHSPSCHQK